MIKRNNKKGFTIVELVIVIAVIAILAAVLIPTFAGIIKKANLSADEQAVRQMNTALAMYEAENGKPANKAEAKKALDEALVNVEGGLVPVTQGYAFYWDSVNNKVVLVGGDDTIGEGWELLTANGFGTLKEVSDASAFKAAVDASSNAAPALIKLEKDLTLDAKYSIGEGKAVIIDLNNKTLSVAAGKYTKLDGAEANCALIVENGGTLTIEGGTIDIPADATRGIVNQNGSLTLNHVNVNSKGVAVFVEGFGDTSIVDCEIETSDYFAITSNSNDDSADGARISIVDSKISSTNNDSAPIMISIAADVTIDNCEVSGTSHAMVLHCATAKITNTKFTSTLATSSVAADAIPSDGNNCPAAAVVVMAHGGGWGNNGNYTFENCTITSGSAVDVFVYSADANCNLVVNGIGDAAVNAEATRGAGKITINK